MTYWNELTDSHLRFGESEKYQEFPSIKEYVNTEGYVGDLLGPSDTVFLGTCDIMSIAPDPELHWARQIHKEFHHNSKFIALGSTGTGVPTMVRRLYAYIQNYGAPKNLYMVIPRFDGYEFVNSEGKCYNVSSRFSSPYFCDRHDMINQHDLNVWIQQLHAIKKTNNQNNIRYVLEERFALIETLCKLHNINLKWTFNLSDMSIRVLYENLSIFEDISDYMKKSFVGLASVHGHNDYDESMDIKSHIEIYNKFKNPELWDYEKLCRKAVSNYELLEEGKPVFDLPYSNNVKVMSTSNGFTFYNYDRSNAEVNEFYITNMTKLHNSGYSVISSPKVTDFMGAIVCKENDNIIAALYYRNAEVDRHSCLVAVLSHVDNKYRNKGLFRQLHSHLDSVVKENNFKGVVSYQSVNNVSMNSPRTKVGYVPKYTVYYRPLLPENK